MGTTEARKQGVIAGTQRYLWADAVANALYQQGGASRDQARDPMDDSNP